MSSRGIVDATQTRAAEAEGSEPTTLQLLVIGKEAFSTHALPRQGTTTIGRAAEADIQVPDPLISRKHLAIHVGPALEVEDLASANGTRLGPVKLEAGRRATLAIGEPVHLGSTVLMVQRVLGSSRARRVWSHGYFEARLEEECARAEESSAPFAVVRAFVEEGAGDALLEVLGEVLGASDVLATYAPGEHEMLVFGDASHAEAVMARLVASAKERGLVARTGIACHPRDGRTADTLIARVSRAIRGSVPEEKSGAPSVVVEDHAMVRLYELVDRVAPGMINVLILGETGVGKDVVAEALHRRSPRARQPLLRLNCAALSETLLESEIFGHERGAFTGAVASKAGLLETAEGGTVFFDEVGELPLGIQAKLLRVIETREVTRVGGLRPKSIDVRFVAATNRELESEIGRGAFRSDLFYRLNGFSLVVPPLRERTAEIASLARAFVAQYWRLAGRLTAPPSISPDALAVLQGYRWPGNIRELRNVIERATLLVTGGSITAEHLPMEKMQAVFAPGRKSQPPAAPPTLSRAALDPAKADTTGELSERELILEALERHAGNQTRAAKSLGISRRTLINRLEEYGIQRPRMPPSKE